MLENTVKFEFNGFLFNGLKFGFDKQTLDIPEKMVEMAKFEADSTNFQLKNSLIKRIEEIGIDTIHVYMSIHYLSMFNSVFGLLISLFTFYQNLPKWVYITLTSISLFAFLWALIVKSIANSSFNTMNISKILINTIYDEEVKKLKGI
jgi:hypothetical protein